LVSFLKDQKKNTQNPRVLICAHGFAAKNVALGGVKSITLHDPAAVQIADLSSQVRLFVLFVFVS
jgi:hypothetical protein